ncbi:MAG: hypothetical protein JNN06_11815 [Gemmobacter sp.]|uniref:hypothetical protein n=1 Tax=Gemmobacter sp. TaxID=1898957 RepID=UPI001A56201D|nr:hypothetical protein [Gemmobacter sp.]MBL8562955.1 hypothetical protein [Gemmobacter sp.]
MTRAQTNGLALGLALAAVALGYLVPLVGPILAGCLLLIVMAAMLGDAGPMAELVFRPFQALARWLARPGEGRWLRRAPVCGLLAGAIGRWMTGSGMGAGS